MGQSHQNTLNNPVQINNENNQTNSPNTSTTSNLSNNNHYIWIDEEINEKWFSFQFNELFNEQRKCSKCNTVDKGIEEFTKLKFEKITIIISGRLFPEFCKKFNKRKNEFQACPTIIIFCVNKELFISNLKINNNYNNNNLLNKKQIFKNLEDLKDILNREKEKEMEEEDFTFDEIEDIRELIIPCFYSYLIQEVTENEIHSYNQNIISSFHDKNKKKEENIKGLVNQLEESNLNIKGIISKYWLHIYTYPSEFYTQLNKSFRKKQKNIFIYHPLIKICYEGIRSKFLDFKIDKELYRGTLISKKELENLIKKMKANKLKKEEEFQKTIIVYSRTFLSFSQNKDIAISFILEPNDNKNLHKVLFTIENIGYDEKNIDKNTISNCNLKEFSRIETEEEILFFPFSCFEVIDYEEKKEELLHGLGEETIYYINLKYLGKYGNIIKYQFGKNMINEIKETKYSYDLLDSKITKNKDFASSWVILKKFSNNYNDNDELCFMVDDKDFAIKTDNSIKIISLFEEIKYFEEFEHTIISLIKIDKSKICASFSNNYIKIIELLDDNRKVQINYEAKIPICAFNLIFLFREKKSEILFSNNKSIYCIDEKQRFKEILKENNNILLIKELSNYQIIYLTEEGNNIFIHFICLNNKNNTFFDNNDFIKEANKIEKEKFNDFKGLDILKDYCVLGFDKTVYIIYYEKKKNKS